MDIVFNHCVGITALQNGQATRLRFGCNEKVANVTINGSKDAITLENRSHHDIALSSGIVLKSVPRSAFRFESSHETTTRNSKTAA